MFSLSFETFMIFVCFRDLCIDLNCRWYPLLEHYLVDGNQVFRLPQFFHPSNFFDYEHGYLLLPLVHSIYSKSESRTSDELDTFSVKKSLPIYTGSPVGPDGPNPECHQALKAFDSYYPTRSWQIPFLLFPSKMLMGNISWIHDFLRENW